MKSFFKSKFGFTVVEKIKETLNLLHLDHRSLFDNVSGPQNKQRNNEKLKSSFISPYYLSENSDMKLHYQHHSKTYRKQPNFYQSLWPMLSKRSSLVIQTWKSLRTSFESWTTGLMFSTPLHNYTAINL